MRGLPLLLGALIGIPAVASAQRPDADRSHRDRVVVPDERRDGPPSQYRYGRDDDDREIQEFRAWRPDVGGRAAEDRNRCERIAREEAEWRRDAREREAGFHRDMGEREPNFRGKELDRWRDHQRDTARKSGRDRD